MDDRLHEAKFVWSDDGHDHRNAHAPGELGGTVSHDGTEPQGTALGSNCWLGNFQFNFDQDQRKGERGQNQTSSHGERSGIPDTHDWLPNSKFDFSHAENTNDFRGWGEHLIGSPHDGHDSYFDQYPAEADGGNSPSPLFVLVEGSNTEYQINPAIDLLHVQTDWLVS
jgi:hypothetical protein